MNKVSKVLVTVIVVLVFFVLFAIVVGLREQSGHSSPGLFGLMLAFGLIGALKAIWKKSDDNDIEKK